MKIFANVAILAGLFLLPGVAQASSRVAQVAPQDVGPSMEPHLRGLVKALQRVTLSSAQQTSVDDLVKANRAETRPLRHYLRTLRTQIVGLMAAGATDDLAKLQHKELVVRNKLLQAEDKVAEGIRGVLSDTQRVQVAGQFTNQ